MAMATGIWRFCESENIAIQLRNGAGNFQALILYTMGSTLEFVAVGDFNADGKADPAMIR